MNPTYRWRNVLSPFELANCLPPLTHVSKYQKKLFSSIGKGFENQPGFLGCASCQQPNESVHSEVLIF